MLERPDAGDAGMPGMLAKFVRMQRMLVGMLATVRGDLHGIAFEGRATWHQKPVARPGAWVATKHVGGIPYE